MPAVAYWSTGETASLHHLSVDNIVATNSLASAMGKSRSATVVCAFLMHQYRLSAADALARVREARAMCEPNEGFMQQLQLYHEMGQPDDVDTSPPYQRWLYRREVESSRGLGQAPAADKIRFEDEHDPDPAGAAFELRCRKCRSAIHPALVQPTPPPY